ncbi:hypothetical protein ACWDWO_06610 [Actinopolymorpha singaporensis]|uniref:Uncharacterized protein n=1 Tax=Actinopolymorpha singaporensis TaxID=117157 RepID=A0A1H1R2J3_9ACTN|nr:hypothetical protein [Actinopolymorpha singaporensis]SDS30001.1 hypothetical protein SAMN04489717_2252 [Actinopolymorpha singaporensis]
MNSSREAEVTGLQKQTNPDLTGSSILVGWREVPERGVRGLFGNYSVEPVMRQQTAAEQAVGRLLMSATDAEETARVLAIAAEHAVQVSPPPPPPRGGGPSSHYARIDAARIAITILLVVGVLAMVIWALIEHDPTVAAQYVAPVSGLAGIGLGWLFTNGRSPTVLEAELAQRTARRNGAAGGGRAPTADER